MVRFPHAPARISFTIKKLEGEPPKIPYPQIIPAPVITRYQR